jgi:membrane protein DedA with SNARE-associated domain
MEWISIILDQAMAAISQSNVAAMISLFFIVALTEMGVPFPFILDASLFVTSYQTGIISSQVALVFLVVFMGRQFGAAVVYWLTRWLGNAFTHWLGKRFPSVPRNLAKVEDTLGSQAIWAITIARLSSLLTVASVASGVCKLRYYNLATGVALSSLIFDGALILLGSGAGVFLPHMSPWVIVIGLIVLLSFGWGGHFLWVRRKRLRKLSN